MLLAASITAAGVGGAAASVCAPVELKERATGVYFDGGESRVVCSWRGNTPSTIRTNQAPPPRAAAAAPALTTAPVSAILSPPLPLTNVAAAAAAAVAAAVVPSLSVRWIAACGHGLPVQVRVRQDLR